MQKFDVLLVDEAQDLSNDEIFVLLSVVKRDRHIAIFSDENQTLFATEWSLNYNVFDMRPVVCDLKRNYRNTDKILEHFRCLTGEDTTPMIRPCREFQTKPVQELNADESIKRVVVELLSGQLSEGRARRPRDIVVLSDRNEMLNLLINEPLSYAGSTIPFKRYQCKKNGEPLSWNEGKRQLGKWREDKCVLVETIQSFKGLEANCVVLVIAGNLPSQDENDKLRYVGESRAKNELCIVDLSEEIK
jgi:superfamily I DNA/RNA helicase